MDHTYHQLLDVCGILECGLLIFSDDYGVSIVEII